MEVIAVYNIKGGVGKTSSCVNIAAAAAQKGKKVIVWDLDPQQATSFILHPQFNQTPQLKSIIAHPEGIIHYIHDTMYDNLKLIPSDLSFKDADISLFKSKDNSKKVVKNIIKVIKSQDFDVLFLDCTPGFSELAEAIFKIADIVLMPIIPTTLSLQSYHLVKRHFEEKNIPQEKLMPFFNMVDIRRNLHIQLMKENAAPYRFFQHYIPNLSEIEKTASEQKPIIYSRPSSIGALSYKALWEEIEEGIFD